jgi:hypothetical protein
MISIWWDSGVVKRWGIYMKNGEGGRKTKYVCLSELEPIAINCVFGKIRCQAREKK